MRSTRLTILAILSLVALAVLLCAYFIDGDMGFGHVSSSGRASTNQFCTIASWRGAMGIAWGKYTYPSSRPSLSAYYQMGKTKWLIGLPQIDPSLRGFACEIRNAPTRRTFYIACPNWLLILPCTIAPILWWRRRRTATMRGFDVEPREIANPSPASGT